MQISPLKLGKITISLDAIKSKNNAPMFDALNLHIEHLEKVVMSKHVVLICKSEKFRDMEAKDKSIPSYQAHIEWSDILMMFNVTFTEEKNSGTTATQLK